MSQNILKASHIELQGYRRCGRKRDGDVSLIIFKLPIWANTLRERAAKESIETATASNGVSRTYAMVSSHYSRRQLLANAPIAASRASWCAFQSGDHFRTHARMTLTGLSCCSGRQVALLSASKMKVPPGLMAIVSRMRSLSSHATMQAWLHSPSTKRMTLPAGPVGPGGPAGPASPASPFAPLVVLGASEQLPKAIP